MRLAGSHIRTLELALVVIVLFASVATLAMGGFLKPKTVEMVDASNLVSSVFGEPNSQTTIGYAENFSGWQSHKDAGAIASLSTSTAGLEISGSFNNNSTATAVGVVKRANIDVSSYQILEIDLNVTQGVSYGLRFLGLDSNGTQYNLWSENSVLDHRHGAGYEVIRMNMLRQAFLVSGRSLTTVTQLSFYVESRPTIHQDFQAKITKLDFKREMIVPLGGQNDYRALYVNLNSEPQGPSSWYLYNFQLGITLQATPNTAFTIQLVNGPIIYTTIESPSNVTYSPLTSTYNIVFYPQLSGGLFSEMLTQTNNESIVLVVNFFFLPQRSQSPDLPGQSGFYYVYLVFFLFLLPVGVAILIYQEFFNRKSVTKFAIWTVLAVGLACRLALAPITAHVFDMNVLLTSARSWFQYDDPSGSLGPTTPLTFFLYWVPYSFYVPIQALGIGDVFLPGHAAGMMEATFIKLFPIAVDVFLFATLLKFNRSGKTFVWASFYLLNPLAIFVSSVRGHYDAATMSFIAMGVYWLTTQRQLRAGFAFFFAGMIQLLGFIPYSLLLIKSSWGKQFKLVFGLMLLIPLSLIYVPQANALYRLVLGISGLTSTQFSLAGKYSLVGIFAPSALVSQLHLLLLAGAILGLSVFLDLRKGRLDSERIVLYTGLSAVVFLLLSNLVAEWLWLLPIGIVYSILRSNDRLGGFMLIFGTVLAFVEISYTAGSAYYLLGASSSTQLTVLEVVSHGTYIFAIMSTILAGFFLAYAKPGRNLGAVNLRRSSLLLLTIFILVYFWVGVYPMLG